MATLTQLLSRVVTPLDMQDYSIVSSAEVTQSINDGIKRAEAQIHMLYEDYFLAYETLNIVSGTATYSLPSDIYARKIRKVIYNDGSSIKYEVIQLKDLNHTAIVDDNDEFKYRIFNDSSNGVQLTLFPTPAETNSFITIYYIRDAKQLSSGSDVCDIPEYEEYVVKYAQVECLKKEMSNPLLQTYQQDLQVLGQEMIDSLSQAIDDGNVEIDMDLSFYDDFYNQDY